MAKGHRKPNSERVVDTDVLADHRESCVEKAQASGEPCALKGASTVREGAVGKGLSSGYHLEVQAGRNGISTSLAAYFIKEQGGVCQAVKCHGAVARRQPMGTLHKQCLDLIDLLVGISLIDAFLSYRNPVHFQQY